MTSPRRAKIIREAIHEARERMNYVDRLSGTRVAIIEAYRGTQRRLPERVDFFMSGVVYVTASLIVIALVPVPFTLHGQAWRRTVARLLREANNTDS